MDKNAIIMLCGSIVCCSFECIEMTDRVEHEEVLPTKLITIEYSASGALSHSLNSLSNISPHPSSIYYMHASFTSLFHASTISVSGMTSN